LIALNLLLLAVIGVFLTLQLVTDQRSGSKAEPSANCRSGPGMSNGGSNETTRQCPAERADTRAFLARRQGTTSAPGSKKHPCQYEYEGLFPQCYFHVRFSFIQRIFLFLVMA
jgi:hypothetical protein